MPRTLARYALFLSFIMSAAMACQRVEGPEQDSAEIASQGSGNKLNTAAHKLPCRVEGLDEVWVLFQEEPARHFRKALELYRDNNPNGAAESLRKASAFMELQACRGDGKTKGELKLLSEELRKTAQELKDDGTMAGNNLTGLFSKSHRALAALHHRKAEQAYVEKRNKTAGHELKAAADNLEHASFWSQCHLAPEITQAAESARAASEDLVLVSSPDPARIAEALHKSGLEIERLASKIEMEDIWTLFAGRPDYSLQRAKENLNRKAGKAASADLRTVSACLALEKLRAGREDAQALQSSIEELNAAADQIIKGNAMPPQKLDAVFARSQFALASHHWNRASSHLNQKYEWKCAEALRAAATDTESAIAWSGREMRRGTDQIMNKARTLAQKIFQGEEWTEAEVINVIAKGQKIIGDLDN